MAYRAVCFDLDRTLCRSTQDPEELLARTFDRAGVDPFCTHADLREAVPAVSDAQNDRQFHEYLFAEVARRTDADPTSAPALADAYMATYDPTAVEFVPGAKRAIDCALDCGPVGLITNGERSTQVCKLESLDITDVFDVTVFCDPPNGIHPKPDPAPFERALSTLSTEPAETIHVGDSLPADVRGANSIGMSSAWVANGSRGEETADGAPAPTYVLDSPGDVDRLF